MSIFEKAIVVRILRRRACRREVSKRSAHIRVLYHIIEFLCGEKLVKVTSKNSVGFLEARVFRTGIFSFF